MKIIVVLLKPDYELYASLDIETDVALSDLNWYIPVAFFLLVCSIFHIGGTETFNWLISCVCVGVEGGRKGTTESFFGGVWPTTRMIH